MNKYLVLFSLLAFNAQAQTPEMIADYGDWRAFYYYDQDAAEDVCYLRSSPIIDKKRYNDRSDVYMTISSNSTTKNFDVVSIKGGYKYQEGSSIDIKVGTKSIDKIFAKEDTAWSVSPNVDKEIVSMLKDGARMIISATNDRGQKTKDIYSLKGFNEAYMAMQAKCPR